MPKDKPTSTPRVAAFQERLFANEGKRVVVDMPKEVCDALALLLDARYANTQADVVRKAVLEAARRVSKRSRSA